MQDTNITYRVTATGIDEVRAKFESLGASVEKFNFNLKTGMVTGVGRANSALGAQADATDRVARATDRATRSQASYLAHIARTTVQSAAVNKLFLEFINVSGQAIEQVDLMNNFPATMASMGQSTDDATESFQALNKYVGQVGGNLGQAVSMVTRFTGVTNDVKAATAIYQGLNNALIAGDTTLEEQKNAAIQFGQALERGKPDMREWNTLSTVMSQQLGIVAEKMGYASASDLGDSLREGEESMAAFTTELTKLSTGEGVIAEQAYARMNGIQFAFNVMRNTMVQGLAAIINAFGRSNIVAGFQLLTQVIQLAAQATVTLINVVLTLINAISRLFGGGEVARIGGDAIKAADALDLGAGAADDMGKNLKKAKKDSDELTKSLASFDKMNVLADKTSGKDKDDEDEAGGSKFSAGQIAELGKLLDGANDKIQQVSTAAKVLFGVLAGLTGLAFAKFLVDQFNSVISTVREASENVKGFKKNLSDDDEKKGSIFTRARAGALALGTSIGSVAVSLAALAFNPFVLIAAAIAALIVGIIYLYNTNEDFKKGFDAIWTAIGESLRVTADMLRNLFGNAVDYVRTKINGLPGPFRVVLEDIGRLVKGTVKLFGDLGNKIGLTGEPLEVVGKVVGALAASVALLTTSWLIYQGAILAASVATGIFGAIMGAVSAPVLIIVAVIALLVGAIYLLYKNWGTISKGAGIVWKEVKNIWGAAGEWFKTNVTERVSNLFSGLWDKIKSIWFGVPGWFKTNVTDPTYNFFLGLWNGIKAFIGSAVSFFTTVFAQAWTGARLAFSGAVAFFQGVRNGIGNIFAGIGGWFGGVFNGAANAIRGAFGSIIGFFGHVWNSIANIFRNVGGYFGQVFRAAFNGVASLIEAFVNNAINLINKLINGINGVAGKVGIPRIANVPRATIPRLARGGVVNQATMAIIGESGSEAVMPLENNTEWIDKLAEKINTRGGGNSQPVHITVQIGEEQIATKVIDLINEKTHMSGRNSIFV